MTTIFDYGFEPNDFADFVCINPTTEEEIITRVRIVERIDEDADDIYYTILGPAEILEMAGAKEDDAIPGFAYGVVHADELFWPAKRHLKIVE